MFLVQNNLTIDDCLTHGPTLDYPRSVVDFMAGKLGQPYGGFPKALQSAILGPMKPISTRMGGTLEPYDFDAGREKIMAWMPHEPSDEDLISHALYPTVFEEYWRFRKEFGEISHLPTPAMLFGLSVGETIIAEIEAGKTLVVKLTAVGGLTEDGRRSVYFELNGQPREVTVEDTSAASTVKRRRQFTPGNPDEIGATMPGKVVAIQVNPGETVTTGATVIVLEAMKMETAITAPREANIAEIHAVVGDKVNAGDLLVTLTSDG